MIRRLVDSLRAATTPAADKMESGPVAAPVNCTLLTLDPSMSTTTPLPDIDAMANCAEAAVEALDIDLVAWLESDLALLGQAWDLARQSEFETASIRALYRASHNLNGMAATYGYPDIGRVARSLCRILGRAQAPRDAALINLHIEACRVIFRESRNSGGTQALTGELCTRLESKVDKALSA